MVAKSQAGMTPITLA